MITHKAIPGRAAWPLPTLPRVSRHLRCVLNRRPLGLQEHVAPQRGLTACRWRPGIAPAIAGSDVWKEGERLWRNPESSDVTLLVYPAGDGPDGAWTSGKPEPLTRIPLHFSTVLANVSPEQHRGHLLRLWQYKDHSSPAIVELVCFPGEPEAVPEAVLHHAYTGILPDEAHLLAWMMWRAEFLGMPATVAACLAKLQAMAEGGKLTVQDLVVINSLPALKTDSKAAVEQQVAQMASQVLLSRLRVARQVVADERLLDQFVQLPFPLLKQWATLRSIEVDSENTVAVLITAWYDHHLHSTPPATAPTEQQCKELSALICLDKLSPSFHLQALPQLRWYRPPPDLPQQHAVLRVLSGLVPDTRKPVHQAALASGGAARYVHPVVTHEWSLSRQQLQQLWADGQLALGCVYFAGFNFTEQLVVQKQGVTASASGSTAGGGQQQAAAGAAEQQQAAAVKPRTLGLYLSADWPSILLHHSVGNQVPDPVTAVQVDWELDAAATAAAGAAATAGAAGAAAASAAAAAATAAAATAAAAAATAAAGAAAAGSTRWSQLLLVGTGGMAVATKSVAWGWGNIMSCSFVSEEELAGLMGLRAVSSVGVPGQTAGPDQGSVAHVKVTLSGIC